MLPAALSLAARGWSRGLTVPVAPATTFKWVQCPAATSIGTADNAALREFVVAIGSRTRSLTAEIHLAERAQNTHANAN